MILSDMSLDNSSHGNAGRMRRRVARRRAVAAAVIAVIASAAQAQTAPSDSSWTFAVTPYLWLPSFEGTLRYSLPPGSGNPEVGVQDNHPLSSLDAAFMIAGEARRGRLSFFGDYIYLKFSPSSSSVTAVDFNPGAPPVNPLSTTVDRGTTTQLKGQLFTLAAGYNLAAPDAPLDAIGGVRYLTLDSQTDWQLSAAVAGSGAGQTFAASGAATRNQNTWDAIVGARGRARLMDRWFVPYYLDIGAGTSRLTWEAQTGVGYSFRWGDLTLAYRYLFYDQGQERLLHNFSFKGATLAASFRF